MWTQNIATYLCSLVELYGDGNGNAEPKMKRFSPRKTNIVLMEEMLLQLILRIFHVSFVWVFSQVVIAGFLPSTVSPENWCLEDKPFLLTRSLFRGAVHFQGVCLSSFQGWTNGQFTEKSFCAVQQSIPRRNVLAEDPMLPFVPQYVIDIWT